LKHPTCDLDFELFWADLDAGALEPVPDWLVDRQARSRQTRQTILSASHALIANRRWAGVTIPEISELAGVSVGAVYARFPSKEAVLTVLGWIVLSEASLRFASALDTTPVEDGGVAVVQAYVGVLVTEMIRHRRVLTELRESAPAVPEIRELLDRTNRTIHTAFIDRALHAVAPDRAHDLRFGLFMANANAREAILTGSLATYALDLDAGDLSREISRAFVAYLGA
jgi:AcrR family transcriptional regulator